jgi:hypothetical protein
MGFAIIARDMTILKAPTPIVAALYDFGISLDIPCMILATPLISKATAARITRDADVSIGNCNKKIESPTITSPSTILMIRVFLNEATDIPIASLSIPRIKNTMDRNRISPNTVAPGTIANNDSTTTESVIDKAPKTICSIRSHGGDLTVCTWKIQLTVTYIDDDKRFISLNVEKKKVTIAYEYL